MVKNNARNNNLKDIEIGKLIASVEHLIEKIDSNLTHTRSIDHRLTNLERDYTRYRGFVGGVTFLGGAIWVFMTFTWDHLRNFTARLFGLDG